MPNCESVLIHAPFGRDAEVIRDALASVGASAMICGSIGQFCAQFEAEAGAGIITAEALAFDDLQRLASALAAQPPWSDFPLIILFESRGAAGSQDVLLTALSSVGNLNMLERPLRVEALTNAVTLALRARRRQYEAQAHMRQLEEAQEGLARARNEAIRANEAKTRFLAAASHDLRQPFQAMRLFHHIVSAAVAATPASVAAARLGDAIQSGEDLLNSLLDLSTLEAGVTKVDMREFGLTDVLQTVANDLGGIAAGKGLELRVRSCPVAVRSDPVLLTRMIRNLAINAIRYTERGKVLLGCRARVDHVLIQVWDTGIGIAADKVEQIFEDFYQVDNPERDRSKGIGLGLSIVERMARLLGHDISVRSRPGRGTVFTVKVARAS